MYIIRAKLSTRVFLFSLKGWHVKAQGIALGILWIGYSQAEGLRYSEQYYNAGPACKMGRHHTQGDALGFYMPAFQAEKSLQF